MYKTPIKPSTNRVGGSKLLTMAQKGINKSVFSQFLDADQAITIENYIPSQEGYLRTRGGMSLVNDFGGSVPISKAANYHDNFFAIAYGTNLKVFDKDSGATTTIKSDFTSDSFGLARYGAYMFITSKKNGLWRASRQATFSERLVAGDNCFILGGTGDISAGQTLTDSVSGATGVIVTWESSERRARVGTLGGAGAFASGHAVTGGTLSSASITSINALHAGSTITGATSGATALVVVNSSGTLTLTNIEGTFQNGEQISDNYASESSFIRGRGTLTSAVSYDIDEVTGAPKASVVSVIENRLYLGDLEDDSAAIAYSAADLNTGVPFTNWTSGASSSAAGRLNFQRGGKVKKILSQGNLIVVLQEDGEFAFYHDILESSGSYYKIDRTQDYREGWGSSSAAISTDSGIFYANEAGLFQLASVGQTNVPFSKQEQNLSWSPLGAKYFENVNLENADMAWNPIDRTVILTCGLDSVVNNHVIVYNIDTKAFYFFTGWALAGLFYHRGYLYGYDASTAKFYELLSGYDDDGFDISRKYIQEIQLGDLHGLSTVKNIEIQTFLSSSSELNFYIDIYDADGVFKRGAAHYVCSPNTNGGAGGAGYGGAGYGSAGYGGGVEAGLISWIDQCAPFVRNAQRAFIRIESTGSDVHSISYLKFDVEQTGRVRKRIMTRQ